MCLFVPGGGGGGSVIWGLGEESEAHVLKLNPRHLHRHVQSTLWCDRECSDLSCSECLLSTRGVKRKEIDEESTSQGMMKPHPHPHHLPSPAHVHG